MPRRVTRLTESEKVDIIEGFTVDLISAADLAKKHEKSKPAIYNVLRRNGIDPKAYGRLTVTCTACGEPVSKPRNQVRGRKHLFCNIECYYGYIEGLQQGSYEVNRQGQRIARLIVSHNFDLQPHHIVHHEDRNNKNCELNNLRVFASQGDHIRYHRWAKDGVEIKPIWDGSAR